MPAKSKPADPAQLVTEDAIRQRAYYLWEADGRPDGRNEHYWGLAHWEATQAFVAATSNGVAKATKGKAPNVAPPAVKASKATKEKVKAKAKVVELKPAKKVAKLRAAPVLAAKAK